MTGMTQNLPSHWNSGRLATVKPNIILIMLGTNDIGVEDVDVVNAPDRLANYIDQIYNQPGVGNPSIFVASIPPNRRTTRETTDVMNFNSAVPGIVSAQQALGRDVNFVDQFTPLNDNFDTAFRPDRLHPNATGNVILAQQWFNSIASAAPAPEPEPEPEPDAQDPVFEVILQEDFDGDAGTGLDGTSPIIGTGTWSAGAGFNADGSVLLTANRSAAISIGDVINDAAGTPEGLFQLTATLEPVVATGNNWYSLGFSQQTADDVNVNDHFLTVNNGIGTMRFRTISNNQIDFWAGNGFSPNGLTPFGNTNLLPGVSGEGSRTLTVQIDLRNANGTDDFGTVTFFDSGQEDPEVGVFNYTNAPSNGTPATEPMFNSIMLSGNAPQGATTGGAYSNLTLSQVVVSGGLLCDVNMDGAVNFLDISPFISALSDPMINLEADCNEDGVDNFLDIAPFINILAGGGA